MDSTPPPQTFFFKKWKIIDLKKIELPLLNRWVIMSRDIYLKTWKTNYWKKISDIHASPQNIKWFLAKLCVRIKKKMLYLPTPFFNMQA
jgi:hypothetical protein